MIWHALERVPMHSTRSSGKTIYAHGGAIRWNACHRVPVTAPSWGFSSPIYHRGPETTATVEGVSDGE
jgi:hypothetical protein